ncbi:MAG: conjugal transfer protein TraX [Lachnospiraceae bacterium]|nr:conjugal transfer protein TraX [Lachnospiraceae bacterium]
MPEKFQKLDGAALKIIAVASMLIDHLAAGILLPVYIMPYAPISQGTSVYTLYQIYNVMRGIGRAAFPIYCFLLVEGFLHTRNRSKYLQRLLIFALISELPFDLCFQKTMWDLNHQNVFFTLALGLMMLMLWEYCEDKPYKGLLRFLTFVLTAFTAFALCTDYDVFGILLILVLYLLRKWRVPQVFFGLLAICYELPEVILGFIPILLYNGKRGRQLKMAFYALYPIHLLLFYLLSVLLQGGV